MVVKVTLVRLTVCIFNVTSDHKRMFRLPLDGLELKKTTNNPLSGELYYSMFISNFF